MEEVQDEELVRYNGGAVQGWHRNARRIRVSSGVIDIPAWAFQDRENLTAVDLNNVSTISNGAFHNCRSLERVICSTASAVEIGAGAFGGCSRLREIDLRNVTKVGARAFEECQALKRVTIPSSVIEIEESAFELCNNLTEVKLGEGIKNIGKRAFASCSGLVRINFPSTVTDIESSSSGLD